MKLRNKKTGEIREIKGILIDDMFTVNSLAELNEEWEDFEEPKEYWYLENNGDVDSFRWDGDDYDKRMMLIGNCFSSKEEAEKTVKKLKAWKRLKDKGISFEAKVIDRKWYLEPKTETRQRTFDEVNAAFKDIMFIFGGEE